MRRCGSHTNTLIPLYARSAGTHRLKAAAKQRDPIRGPYLDNTDIAKMLLQLMKRE